MSADTIPREEELALITQAIDALGDGIKILEAGCGRKWPLRLSVRYELVGIDEDEEALKARVEQTGDLHEYQLASLGDASFPPRSFDVIYCSYVLEHVSGVDAVLESFARWIRPGGLIVLRVPDDRSVYGFVARHTPHWTHVVFKRYLYGNKNAGRPGHAPYPVVYERAMSQEGIAQYCRAHQYSLTTLRTGTYLKRNPWITPAAMAISWLSLGRLAWRHNNLAFLITAGQPRDAAPDHGPMQAGSGALARSDSAKRGHGEERAPAA